MFECILCWVGMAALAGVAVVAILITPAMLRACRTKRTADHPSEAEYTTEGGARGQFPSINDEATLLLSLVVPAYNEAERIRPMLDDTLRHLAERKQRDPAFTYEIVVVDDGSKDTTVEVVSEYVGQHGSDTIRICKLFKNHGKGGAVRKGMLRARGQYILMVDADGATATKEIDTVLARIQEIERNGHGVVVGSRSHLEEEEDAKAQRTAFRKFLQWGFHTVMKLLVGAKHDIKDTQCGFKLFTRATTRRVFPHMHIERWAFDVEALYITAAVGGIPMYEQAVEWQEIDGSKLDMLEGITEMARDLLVIRLCYLFGIWSFAQGRGDKKQD